jgi:phage protein D
LTDKARVLRAVFYVRIGGLDVSDRINPFLTYIEVHQRYGGGDDDAIIELADDYGQIAIPPYGTNCEIDLGWQHTGAALVFEGFVTEVHSRGGREGRFLRVIAYGSDHYTQAKQPQEGHVDNASLGEAAAKFAGNAGLTLSIHPLLAKIKRAWWGINGESFIHWAQRTASELGGTLKVIGSHAVMLPRLGNATASGQSVGAVSAAAGDNLLRWDIVPSVGRPQHAGFIGRYFDLAEAEWRQIKSGRAALERGIAKALGVNRFPSADAGAAAEGADGSADNQFADSGMGTVSIIGKPAARPPSDLVLTGARSGVDGTYSIAEAWHRYTRGEGYTTTVTVTPAG